MLDQVEIRPGNEKDINFILNSWLMSNRHSGFPKHVPKDVYYKKHHELVIQSLMRSAVFCAVNKEDPDQIYGWVCIEPPMGIETTRALHYVYVKHPVRGFGICKALLRHVLKDESEFVYTHFASGNLYWFLKDKGYYDPYRFFFQEAA